MSSMDDDLDANIRRALPSALKMALYAAKKQSYEVLKYTVEGANALSTNAALLKDYADEAHMEELEKATKEFVILNAQLAAYKDHLEKMEATIDAGRLDPADLDKLVDTVKAKPKVNINQHDFYKRFCENAGIELEGDADEDVVFQESESTRTTICPVTQLEMENPLRNPACGHTYSEQGIRAHLQRNRKCPVAGCPQRLDLRNLERDVEMEVLLDRRKNSTQNQSASAPTFRGDDEDDEEEEYVVE
ncbi:hypothetical protein Poli38472_000583 [Pythium oligandrum]|uniref:SP-RING-type domain-containing protein n=1 Tax=Pythium oligandrum TaxID=41045 RepID=A0A8K1FFG8_PYTOL|nr:hypothetical protein Poli38472_000583 [Pythium oligandrum]|eukprot:TMW60541.1 hypothetical protein Poli38472_000583 [Pythium oligandrum]